MKRHANILQVLLIGLVACRGTTTPTEPLAAPLESTRAAPTPSATTERSADQLQVEPGSLALRARALADRGRPLDAVRHTLRDLRARLAARDWNDEMHVADTVVATVLLEEWIEATSMWKKAAETLESALPFPAETPPEVSANLRALLARAWGRLGRAEPSRQMMDTLGLIRAWRVIGPFANERGGGFDTVYAPEEKIDWSSTPRGKEREVAWRDHPCPQQPLGITLLDEMLRPNDQAVAYLATAIKVDTPRDVRLLLGSSGAVKVWHHGRLVLARKVARPFHRDQDVVQLALEPGWNPLLVKVGVEERQPWLITARVTELDGRALADASWSAEQASTATSGGRESTPAGPKLARDILVARPEDSQALRLLALWHSVVHPDDGSEKTAKKLAERALALLPNDVDAWYLAARANEPEPGEGLEEIRHNERLTPLKRVLQLEPTHVGALLDLADFWTNQNPLPSRADEVSQRALANAPTHRRAVSVRANALHQLGRSTEAEQIERAADLAPEARLSPPAILARSDAARRRGDVAGAREMLEEAVANGSDERALVLARIEAARDDGALLRCFAEAEKWLERQPFDTNMMMHVARIAEYAEDYDNSARWLERALAVCPENSSTHFALARLAERRNDIQGADQALAEVLRLEPGYDKARRQRRLLASQAEDRFEEPYRWDALTRVGTASATPGANESLVVVDRTTVWRVETDGTEHRYEHVLLQVENLAGIKALDFYWIPYPDDAALHVYNARVVRPDATFERAPAPRGGDGRSGSMSYRGFDMPPLQVGDMVDIEYRVDQSVADVFGQYFGVRHFFQIDSPDPLAPVQRAELIVIAPRDVELHTVEHNAGALEKSVEEHDGLVARRWIARDLRRPATEVAMPDRSEFEPMVDVSTYDSWQSFGAWWWNLIEKEFVTTPAMKEKVAELTRGLTTEEERVRAIARFVGQEIRYNAWAFGTHGYEPFSAATIFERRFGDCKDKSILLRQMLAEIGVESHPVLINAEWRRPDEKLDVAMVGHFNHCIAYVTPTETRAGYYLDATADRNPISYLRADDQGAKVLHVNGGRGTVQQIPYAPPQENVFTRHYDIALKTQGQGEVRLVDSSNGMFGVNNRSRFGGEQGDLVQRIAEALAAAFGKIDVLETKTSNLEDIGVDARIEVRYLADNLFTRDGSGANLRVAFDPIPILEVAPEPVEQRTWELVLDRPFAMTSTVLYRLPQGMQAGRLPEHATVSTSGLLDYSLTTRATEEGIEVERKFTLHERRIPLERYADFRNALAEIRLAETRTIPLTESAALESGSPRIKR